MNFCAIYKVSAIYISCLVIREYLFFVLPAYHVLSFRSVRKRYPMFLDYTSRRWASKFTHIVSFRVSLAKRHHI